jgi:hypothetical protein
MCSPHACHYADFAVSIAAKLKGVSHILMFRILDKIRPDSGKWWQAAENIIPFHSFLKYNSNLLLLFQKHCIS